MDTVIHVSESEILILEDTIYAPETDTFFVISTQQRFDLEDNPYKTAEEFYRKMQALSQDNKITARLFDLLFVTENFGVQTIDADKEKTTSNTPFIPYEGLAIQQITIKHVDIISGSVTDTTRKATSGIVKLANKLHSNTWKSVIRDNLLVKKGERIDPYLLADSERLLRRLRFVEDARIYVFPNHLAGTAELIVVVQDRFAWGVGAGYNGLEDYHLQLYNRNIAGWGKYASGTYFYNKSNVNSSGYEIAVGAQNINNTITEWELDHIQVEDRKSWGVRLDKNFVTPQIKFGGGIDIRTISDSTITFDGEEVHSDFYDLDYQDVWIGRSFVLNEKHERKNLVITGRFVNRKFQTQPVVTQDSNSIFFNRKLLLGQITLSRQDYIRSNYILAFGITEDVPVGYRYSFIFGRDFNQFFNQNYFGFQFFWSFHLDDFGFLLFNQQVGGFDYQQEIEGVTDTEVNYYSPLITWGRYSIRNFLNLLYTTGFHQPPSKRISLEDRIGVKGENINGNSTFTISAESVIFTPWYFYGFRFAPFVYYNYAKVWDYRIERKLDYGYMNIGGGFRIRNESLVFNTIEFRASHFFNAPPDFDPTKFEISFSVPLAFGGFFQYKPTILPFR